MVFHDGNFYFETLTLFPLVQGAANGYKLSPNGAYSVYASGFTMILGVLFDNDNNLYVLENTVGQPGPTPGFGDVVRVEPPGKRQGIGPPGLGQIVQVSFNCKYVGHDTKN